MSYIEITDSEIQPNAPITTSLMTRLRDNPLVRSIQVFTLSGTWTKPQGCEQALVIVVGGGGGGGGNTADGFAGGISSFGSHLSAAGGLGGQTTADQSGGSGGAGSSGDFNVSGKDGGFGVSITQTGSLEGFSEFGGFGGDSLLGKGGYGYAKEYNGSGSIRVINSTAQNGKLYGGGGGGDEGGNGGGGGGGASIKFIASGLGTTETVTVGSGGNKGGGDAGDGADGIVIVWEFYGND